MTPISRYSATSFLVVYGRPSISSTAYSKTNQTSSRILFTRILRASHCRCLPCLSHLLGIKLMLRILNWKDLKFFRPSKDTVYNHIDPLFDEPVNWELIETHWQDLMQVVLSIKAGKVRPSTLLRKLGNNSRKNRLYRVFRELGRVVRTVFLLKYISDIELREQIGATTNKVEAYNGFSKWSFFGGEGVMPRTILKNRRSVSSTKI